MKIIFLGTSHGVPSADRYCQSILLETNGEYYIFDAGAPIADLLHRMNIPFKDVKGIFITHLHGDHTTGLSHFIDLSSWYYKDVNVNVYMPEKRGIDAIKNIVTMYLRDNMPVDRINFNIIEEGLFYIDKNICVSAIKNNHMGDAPSYGFVIKAEGKQILISGDLTYSLDDYPKVLDDEAFDFAVLECAHFGANQLLERIKNAKAKEIAVVHVFPLENYDIFKRNDDSLPFRLLYPKDGDCVEI